MTAAPVWKRGFVSMGAVLVVMVAGVAHAEVVFRKKAPPATDTTSGEAAPSGGEIGTEAAPAGEGAADKATYAPQAEDKDAPEAQAQRDHARADATLKRQARDEQLKAERDAGTPFYNRWQFWAITGGVVVGGILAFVAASALIHQAGGGDIRGCAAANTVGCYGEGR